MELLFSDIKCKLSEQFAKFRIKEHISVADGFTITCHSGALYTKMNTIKSVRRAVEWGAQIVEFDVSFRPDGTPVIIHNASPSQNQGVLLEDALSEVAKSKTCQINLDIKSTKNLSEVDKLVKLKNLDNRVFYTGVFEDWIETVKNNSSIPFYINFNPSVEESNTDEYIHKIINKAKETGAIGINSNYRGVSEKMINALHDNGLLVSLWTANKIDAMYKALSYRSDNITTKKPNILKMIIK